MLACELGINHVNSLWDELILGCVVIPTQLLSAAPVALAVALQGIVEDIQCQRAREEAGEMVLASTA